MENSEKASGWDEQEHQEFYRQLKTLNQEDRSKALISQAQKLVRDAENENPDLLKAAESMMNYWLLSVGYEEDRFQAQQLFRRIYEAMGEEEKARGFR